MADANTELASLENEYSDPEAVAGLPHLKERTTEPAAEVVSDTLDAGLLDRAEEFGISTDGFTNEQLEATLDSFDVYSETLEPAPVETEKPKPLTTGASDFNLPDETDPEIAAAFKGVLGELSKVQTQLKDLTGQMETGEARAVASRIDSHITVQITKHGEAAQKLFSSQARTAVARKMQVLSAGYKHSGQRLPSEGKLFLEAARSTLGGRWDKMLTDADSAKVDARKKQFIERSDSRKKAPMSTTDAAVQAVGAKMQEQGLFPTYTAPPENAGI